MKKTIALEGGNVSSMINYLWRRYNSKSLIYGGSMLRCETCKQEFMFNDIPQAIKWLASSAEHREHLFKYEGRR